MTLRCTSVRVSPCLLGAGVHEARKGSREPGGFEQVRTDVKQSWAGGFARREGRWHAGEGLCEQGHGSVCEDGDPTGQNHASNF